MAPNAESCPNLETISKNLLSRAVNLHRTEADTSHQVRRQTKRIQFANSLNETP